VEKIKIRS